jgi:hypothetical protein
VAEENVGLATVPEGFKNVGGRQQITLFVDKEGVTEEGIVIAVGGWGLVEAIDNRANGRDGVGFGDGRRDCGQKGQSGDDSGDGH